MRTLFLIATAAALIAGITMLTPRPQHRPADGDLVVLNARIWTGDPSNPWAEAIVVSGDTIAYVGSNEVAEFADGATVIDARGRFVTPGFIDSHVHFLTGGENLSSVQLRDADTPTEFIRRIADFAQTVPAGTWITGGDWDHTLWGGELPARSWIDSVTADNPVWVNRLDGHMSLANTAALTAAGVRADQPDVDGGEIVRDQDGGMTGLLKDNATDLVWRAVPDPTPEQKVRAITTASAYVAERGVTSVHDMDGWLSYDAYQTARHEGKLKTRVYGCAPLSRASRLAAFIREHGHGDEWIRTGCVKGFVDGSLGSHTAAFFEPFTDDPSDSGLLVDTEEHLESMMREADSLDLQLITHAIGDRAIHILLNIYERIESYHGMRDRRLRIEHAQHLAPADIPRFAELGVIASMQPYHAIDDGRWAEEVIGPERAKTTYAFRSLIDAGATVAFGSDWFVAPPTPLEGIYAAVTRRTLDDANPDGWVPEQKITVEEALKAYTINAAYASFEDDIKGSLEVGKLADFVIIDRDLTNIPPETIRDAHVDVTVVGGEVAFSGEGRSESGK